jgi:CdiI immunity protein
MKKHGGKGKFAALREFVRGYLNQDFGDEYGSATGAAKAYCDDASEAERARVAKEWKAFVDGTAGDGVDAVNEKLAELGAGWNVVVVKDLDAVSAVFAEYSTK